jgi:hypothetical protein
MLHPAGFHDASSQTVDYLSKFCIVPVRDLVHFRYCAFLRLVVSHTSPFCSTAFLRLDDDHDAVLSPEQVRVDVLIWSVLDTHVCAAV